MCNHTDTIENTKMVKVFKMYGIKRISKQLLFELPKSLQQQIIFTLRDTSLGLLGFVKLEKKNDLDTM